MLHTKFQGHQSIGSGEEDFLSFKVFTIFGHGGHVGYVILSSFHMNFENLVTFDQGQRMTLTFDTH